jgi:hypothetical protein
MSIKNISVYLTAVLGIIFSACSKPYQDALPTVQLTSAVPYGMADSVLLTGTITSAGASPIEYEGFCFSNTPNFDLLTNQVMLNSTVTTFTTVVPAKNDSTYYFKSIAANQYGYSVSSAYKYTLPSVKPDSAPCSLSQNTVYFQGGNTPFDIFGSGSSAFGSYYVEADFGFSSALDIYFNQVPTNGAYYVLNTTDFIDNTGAYVCNISLSGNSFNEGGYVYVSQNTNGSTTVSFCPLTVNISSTNYSVSAKITFN